MNKCCDPACRNTSLNTRGVSFHRPRDDDTKRKWEAAVEQHRGKAAATKVWRMCSVHFAEDAYILRDNLRAKYGLPCRYKKLKHDAVPTIFPDPAVLERQRSETSQQAMCSASCGPEFRRPVGQDSEAMKKASVDDRKTQTSVETTGTILGLMGGPLTPLLPFWREPLFTYLVVPCELPTVLGTTFEVQGRDVSTQTAFKPATCGTQTPSLRRDMWAQTCVTLETRGLCSGCRHNKQCVQYVWWGRH